MQVQIKFKRTGSNSEYGSFAAGDLMRCDSALAKHFVSEGIAVYTEAPVAVVAAIEEVAVVVEATVEAKPEKRTKAQRVK